MVFEAMAARAAVDFGVDLRVVFRLFLLEAGDTDKHGKVLPCKVIESSHCRSCV